MKALSQFNSLIEMTTYFANDEICKNFLAEYRWGDDVICPICGEHHCSKRADGRYRCSHCKHNFSVTVGTIFDNTKLSLRKWFIGMYLISSHKKGVSSHQLSRDLHVTQKTAWFMLQKIRTLYKQDDSIGLKGTIECDEVYLGGKEKWKHLLKRTKNTQGRSTKTKTPIFGMLERSTIIEKGKEVPFSIVRAMVVPNTTANTLLPIIEQFVEEGSHVMTDELPAYNGLTFRGYSHEVVCHKDSQFAFCDVFTNGIEGFWSHLRRMVIGIYHHMSDKYLQRYIDEIVYRWNTRKMDESERFAHMFCMSIGVVKQCDIVNQRIA